MRPEVNSNQFDISLRCKVTSLLVLTWVQAKWNSLQSKFHFGQFDRIEISNCSEFFMWTVNTRSEIKLCKISLVNLITSAHVRCYCYWENNHYGNICFALIKLALIKSYHLRMCIRILLWFGKLPQWNRHKNGTIFERDLRYQGWS